MAGSKGTSDVEGSESSAQGIIPATDGMIYCNWQMPVMEPNPNVRQRVYSMLRAAGRKLWFTRAFASLDNPKYAI